MEITRYILPVVAGSVAAMLLIIFGEYIAGSWFPVLMGGDWHIAPSMVESMTFLPPLRAFVFLLAAYAGAALLGGLTATLLVRRASARPAVVVGIVLTLAGVYKVLYMPYPLWFAAAHFIIYLPSAYMGYFLVKKQP